MSGQFSATGGTITVRINGDVFATITASGTGEPVIEGADGQPLTTDEAAALQNIFMLTGEAFISFDAMLIPVGMFMTPAAV
jgi:hypothetical protein